MGSGSVDAGAHPDQGRTPAHTDAGPAAPGAPDPPIDAERALGILRQPAITVAEGVTEAAVLHLRSLVARLRLANREFHQAERKLDELCTTLRDKTSTPKSGGPCDAALLSSLPRIGTGTLAPLLTQAAAPIKRRDHTPLKTPPGGAPVA